MDKVNNKKALRQLSRAMLRKNMGRNLAVISAIVLTALLFSSLFCLSTGLIHSMQSQELRRLGTNDYGGYKFLTQEEMTALAKEKRFSEVHSRQIIGMVEDIDDAGKLVEVWHTKDKDTLKSVFTPLIKGHLPQKNNEIVTSPKVLAALGVKTELGTKVNLNILHENPKTGDVLGESRKDFYLCGICEDNDLAFAQQIYVSEAFTENVSLGDESWMLEIKTKHLWQTKKILEDALSKAEIKKQDDRNTGIRVSLNPGYYLFKHDIGETVLSNVLTLATVAVLGLIMLLAGWLMISNVFHISVMADIRFYGLLLTLGTTPKQLKRVVQRQALILALIGIPAGVFFGWLLGWYLMPMLVRGTLLEADWLYIDQPWPLLLAAILSLITLGTSLWRPLKMISRLSPLESLTLHNRRLTVSQMKSGKLSLPRLAWAQVRSNGLKSVFLLLSFLLSMVLTTCLVTFVSGFDIHDGLKEQIESDYVVSSRAYQQMQYLSSQGKAVPNTVLQQLEQLPYVELKRLIYASPNGEVKRALSEKERNRIKNPNEVVAYAYLLGVDKQELKKIALNNHVFSEKKEPADHVAILDSNHLEEEKAWMGKDVTLTLANGKKHSLTIQSVFESNLVNGLRAAVYSEAATKDGSMMELPMLRLYIPKDVYLQLMGELPLMRIDINVSESYREEAEKALVNILSSHEEMVLESRQEKEQQLIKVKQGFLLIGGALAGIVFLIGVLNLINVLCTDFMMRRREWALYEAIGMTLKEIRRIVLYECFWIIEIAAIFAAGSYLGLYNFVLRPLSKNLPFLQVEPQYNVLLAIVLLLALISAFTVQVLTRMLLKKSLSERLSIFGA